MEQGFNALSKKTKNIIIGSVIVVIVAIIFIVIFNSVREAQQEAQIRADFINAIENDIIPNLEFFESYSFSGHGDSTLVLHLNDDFEHLTKQEMFDYLSSVWSRWGGVYRTYRERANIELSTRTLGNVTVKTSQNEYSLSSTRRFSMNGITDFELSRANERPINGSSGTIRPCTVSGCTRNATRSRTHIFDSTIIEWYCQTHYDEINRMMDSLFGN